MDVTEYWKPEYKPKTREMDKIRITANRIFSNKNKTLAECFVTRMVGGNVDVLLEYKHIELPWLNNQRNISCIPANIYSAVAINRWSNGKYAIWILDVPNRSQILIHQATFVRHLLGCKAPGENFADLDNDGIIDVENSDKVMKELEKIIPVGVELKYHVIDLYRVIGNKQIEL
jgi:hypothetical protein